jgi:hypothetical protein
VLESAGSDIDLENKIPAILKKIDSSRKEDKVLNRKLNCLRCISHDTAIDWIVKADIYSGILIVPIVKAIGAAHFKADIKTFDDYVKLRCYSIMIEIFFMSLVMVALINIVAFRKLTWYYSVIILGGFNLSALILFMLEFHLQKVLKSAFLAFKEYGEVPKMFQKALPL